MDAGTLSIRTIFGQDRRHIVPLFQRPYVWSREAQWEPLWEDLRTVAERILDGGSARAHFLGAVVFDHVSKPTGALETRLVIDGQQRLTTIQLLLEAFCDVCATKEADRHHKALLKLTRNDDPLSNDPDERFKIWPTNIDQQHFRRVMEAGSPTQVRAHYNAGSTNEVGHPLADAYLFFYQAITEWLEASNGDVLPRIEALFGAVRDNVRLVVIDLAHDDDAQVIFETLNARGTPLLPSDLVKNFLFHRARVNGEAIEPLYAHYWRPFDDDADYWRAELGRGHARRARIDTFLQHYLTLRTGEEAGVAHLYATFRQFAGERATETAAEHLASIRRYADTYRRFDSMPAGSRERLFFDRLTVLEVTTAYPFLLELFEKSKHSAHELQAVLADVESFLIRRMVCQLNTRGYNRFFVDLLSRLQSAEGSVSERVRAHLLQSQSESARWPDDNEFREAWLSVPVYRTLRRDRVVLLLEAAERQLRSKLSESITINESLTIEHVMPQTWQKHWPLPEGEAAEQRRFRLIHTVGNLTLVTKSLNPALSNGRWETKRKAIEEHTLLKLNKQLASLSIWNEDAIVARGAALFDLARDIWAHPSSGSLETSPSASTQDRITDLTGRELSVAPKYRSANPRRPNTHGWLAFEVLRRSPDQRMSADEYERRLLNPPPEIAALAMSVPGVPNAYQDLKHIRCDIARGHVDVTPPLAEAWYTVSRCSGQLHSK
jgi:hypothetical protein